MTANLVLPCLTIVAEMVLEARLLDDLERAGARGWTVTPTRGAGPRHRRISEIEGGNIRVDVIATPDVVERVWRLLEADYFPRYAVIAWETEVRVARGMLFGRDGG